MGGLFSKFTRDSNGTAVVDSGFRLMPAVQMAIDRVNNKSDGIYDRLLPNVQVCHSVRSKLSYFTLMLTVHLLLPRAYEARTFDPRHEDGSGPCSEASC